MILLNYYMTINNHARLPCPFSKQDIEIINFLLKFLWHFNTGLKSSITFFYWNNNAKKNKHTSYWLIPLSFVLVQEVHPYKVPLKIVPAAFSNSQPEKRQWSQLPIERRSYLPWEEQGSPVLKVTAARTELYRINDDALSPLKATLHLFLYIIILTALYYWEKCPVEIIDSHLSHHVPAILVMITTLTIRPLRGRLCHEGKLLCTSPSGKNVNAPVHFFLNLHAISFISRAVSIQAISLSVSMTYVCVYAYASIQTLIDVLSSQYVNLDKVI